METFYLKRHSEHLSFYNKSLDKENVIIFGGPQGLPGDTLVFVEIVRRRRNTYFMLLADSTLAF